MAVAHGVQEFEIAESCLLTSAAASSYVRRKAAVATGKSGQRIAPSESIAVVFSAGGKSGGVRGHFGVDVLLPPSASLSNNAPNKIVGFTDHDWLQIGKLMTSNREVHIAMSRPTLVEGRSDKSLSQIKDVAITTTFVDVQSTFTKHLALSIPKRTSIASFLDRSELIVSVDFLNGAGSAFAAASLKSVGLDEAYFLNSENSPTFMGRTPDATPQDAVSSMGLFGARPITGTLLQPLVEAFYHDLQRNVTAIDIEGSTPAVGVLPSGGWTPTYTSDSSTGVDAGSLSPEVLSALDCSCDSLRGDSSDAPDLGFVLNANADKLMVQKNMSAKYIFKSPLKSHLFISIYAFIYSACMNFFI